MLKKCHGGSNPFDATGTSRPAAGPVRACELEVVQPAGFIVGLAWGAQPKMTLSVMGLGFLAGALACQP